MELDVRDTILKALDEKGYLTELSSEGIVFVEDKDVDMGIAIHIQVTT